MRSELRIGLAVGASVSVACAISSCSLLINVDDLQPADGSDGSALVDSTPPIDAIDAIVTDGSGHDAADTSIPTDSGTIDSFTPPPDATDSSSTDSIDETTTLPPVDTGTDGGAPCTTTCAGKCFDTTIDPNHCGSCAKTCQDDERCVAGSCICRHDLTRCSGLCVDLKGSNSDCSACGFSCTTFVSTCTDGSCTGGSCPSGRTMCSDGCFDLANDATHCGDCTKFCLTDETCIGSTCRKYAPATSGCGACDALVGSPFVCCPAPGAPTHDLCVSGTTCPTNL